MGIILVCVNVYIVLHPIASPMCHDSRREDLGAASCSALRARGCSSLAFVSRAPIVVRNLATSALLNLILPFVGDHSKFSRSVTIDAFEVAVAVALNGVAMRRAW